MFMYMFFQPIFALIAGILILGDPAPAELHRGSLSDPGGNHGPDPNMILSRTK